MRFPRVLVIYNQPVLPLTHPDATSEHDVIATSETIDKILTEAGFPTSRIGFTDPRILVDELQQKKPDVVFNLFEGLATQTETEISVVSLLEWMNIPYTGSPSLAIALGRDKYRTKQILRGAGLPTAAFLAVSQLPMSIWEHGWPVIVKPACQDCSVGIEQASVVTNQEQLEERVAYVLEKYGAPVLIEEFIFGREFHVNFLEDPGDSPLQPHLTMVPLAEIRFDYQPGRKFWPIYSYEAKWNTECEEYDSTPLDSPVFLAPEQMERIRQIGIQAYQLIGLKDYGRLDIRLSESGEPYILEVNPNPYLNSIALIRGLEAMGRSHPQFIVDIVWNALGRAGKLQAMRTWVDHQEPALQT